MYNRKRQRGEGQSNRERYREREEGACHRSIVVHADLLLLWG